MVFALTAADTHRHFHGGIFFLLAILVIGGIAYGIYRLSRRRDGRPHETDVGATPTATPTAPPPAPVPPAPPAPSSPAPVPPPPAPPAPPPPSAPPPAAPVAGAAAPLAAPDSPARARTASPAGAHAAQVPAPLAWPTGGPPAVETHGLVKRFGANAAVDGVDLMVPMGCAFGYLGPNGAGKTTLIRTLLGLTDADEGTMSILGIEVPRRRREALARVGAIVDEPRFHHHLTGRENLRVLAAARGGATVDRIDGAVARVGLTARADDRVASYSMGMRQRLGVAACLLGDPELLILDEPMNGLDPAGMQEMRTMIRDLVGEGRTVMLSSHLLDEVERTCDAVAIVDRGHVIRQGPIRALLAASGSTVRIGCVSPEAGAALLAGLRGVASAGATDGELVVTLDDTPTQGSIAALNRALVEGGVDVFRIEEATTSLEDWFLSVTSRFGSDGG